MATPDTTTQQQPPDRLRKIYDYLKSQNKVRAETYEDFQVKMEDPTRLEKVYNYLKEENKVSAESFDIFQEKVGLKKKGLPLGIPLAPEADPQTLQAPATDGSQESSSVLENGLTEEEDKQRSLSELASQPVVSDIDWRQSLPKGIFDPLAKSAMKPMPEQQIQAPDNGINPAASSAGSFNEMVVDAAASLPKTLGIIGNQAERLFNSIAGLPEPSIDDNFMYKAGQWIQDKALDVGITATNPKYQDSFFLHDVPAAFGSVFAIMATQGRSLAGGKVGGKLLEGISGASPIKEAAKQLGQTLASRPMVTGGMMMGVAEFDQAIASGASEEQAFNVFLANYELGMTEAIPLQRALARINKASGGKIIEVLKNGVVGSIEEAAQEGIQTVLSNWIAQGTYDPERAPFQDMLRSMGAGAFVGFILPGIGAAMQKMTPAQRKKTQEVLNREFKAMKQEAAAQHPDNTVVAPQGDLGTPQTPQNATPSSDQTVPGGPDNNTGQQVNDNQNQSVSTPGPGQDIESLKRSVQTVPVQGQQPADAQEVIPTGTTVTLDISRAISVPTSMVGPRVTDALHKLGYSDEEISKLSPDQINTVISQNIENATVENSAKIIQSPITNEPNGKNNQEGRPDEVRLQQVTDEQEQPGTGSPISSPAEQRADISTEAGRDLPSPEAQAPDGGGVDQTSDRPTEISQISDPEELAGLYMEEVNNPSVSQVDVAISGVLSHTKVKRKSFIDNDDATNITPGMAKSYFDKKDKGTPLDIVAKQASEALNPMGDGTEISEQDVVDFMMRYKSGPNTITTPSGNPRLAEIANQYSTVTGKAINRKIASDVLKKAAELRKKDDANKAVFSDSFLEVVQMAETPGEIDFSDPEVREKLMTVYGLSNEEYVFLSEFYGKQEHASDRQTADEGSAEHSNSVVSDAQSQETTVREGTDVSQRTGSAVESTGQEEIVREIKSKTLTHVHGLNMGSGVAKGTYLSTEENNRYATPGNEISSAEVEISNPRLYTDEDDIIEMRNNTLRDNLDKFELTDFVALEKPDIFEVTIDFLSESGIEKLAGMVSDQLQAEGFDSIYFRESPSQEGELIVFDRAKVKLTPKVGEVDPTPQDAEEIVKHNSRRKKPIGIIGDPANGFMFITDLGEKIVNFFKKQFTSKGFLPRMVFDRWIGAQGEISAIEATIRFTVSDFKAAIKKEYDGKLTDDQITDLNLYLQGKTPSNPIPQQTRDVLDVMRAQIDTLSRKFISQGIVSGDLQATFTKNLGVYLTRSYRKFDDPFWSEFVPPQVRNQAEAFIRNNAKVRAQKFYDKAQRLTQLLMDLPTKLQGLRTRQADLQDIVLKIKQPAKLQQAAKMRDQLIKKVELRIKDLERKLKNSQYDVTKLEAELLDLLDNGAYYEFIEATENYMDDIDAVADKIDKKQQSIQGKNQTIQKLQDRIQKIQDKFTNQEAEIIAHAKQQHDNIQKVITKIATRDYRKEINDAITEADRLYNMTPEEVDGLINYILYDPKAPMAVLAGSKLGSKDLSILKKRGDIAPEIRALMGEYSDPLLNYQRTVTKMVNLIAKHHFLIDVKAKGLNSFLFDRPTGKHHVKLAADGSKTMAPLNGLYTTKEIADAFNEFNSQEPLPPWLRLYMKAISVVKANKTVLSVQTHARNIVGNMGFVVINGHWRVNKIGKAIQVSWAQLYNSDQKIRDKFIEYVKLGIVQDSAAGGEIRQYIKDIREGKDFFETLGERSVGKISRKVLDVTQKAYQAEDDMFKIFAFENEFTRYRKAYPTKTDDEIKRIAADIVRNTYPTYSMVPKVVKALRANPLVGTFVAFPAEALRVTYNTMELTKKELSNKETRDIGVVRLAGILSALLLPTAASMYSLYLLGMDGEDDENIRKFAAPWQKDSEFIYMKNEGAKYTIIDLGYSDPHNYLKRPIYQLLKDGDLLENGIDASMALARPFLDENMLTERLIDIHRNKKASGDHVYNPDAPVGDRLSAIYGHLWPVTEPGTIGSLRRIKKGMLGETDKYGKEYNTTGELLSVVTGQKEETKDITQALLYRAYELKDRIEATEKDFFRVEKNMEATPEQKQEAARVREEATAKILADAKDIYLSAIRLGVDPKVARRYMILTRNEKIFKATAGLK